MSLRKLFLAGFSVVLMSLWILSLPILNHFLRHGLKEEEKLVRKIEVRKVALPKDAPKPEREMRQPQRSRPQRTSPQAGPRFAMDLGVQGMGGASISPELARMPGGGAAEGDGKVDEKPTPASPPAFRLPDAVRASEVDALAVLSFCVDAAGRVYDIRVVRETPPGMGMAQAGREALSRTAFKPARRAGAAVPF